MKFKLNRNQKRLPFGGHHFYENGVMIKGETFDDVVELLTNFRLINGRPIGRPVDEITNYYAKKYPWMVQYDFDATDIEAENSDYLRWRDWIASLWGRAAPKYISRKEASIRWEICKNCPHNVGKTWDDSRESTEFERKSMILRRGEPVPDKMLYCDLHRADISVCSFLESPKTYSKKTENEEQHSGCWFHSS